MTWQLLLSYLPTNSERRVTTLERKRKEYVDGVRQAFERGGTNSASPGRARGLDEAIWHQISIDVPRTNPHIELYSYEATQRSLERILYVWAVRHPASGYVQGINDLVTPFWQVFLGLYIADNNIETGMDPGQLPKSVLDAVEVALVNGDELRWCVGLDSCEVICQCCSYSSVYALLTHGDVVYGPEDAHFPSVGRLPLKLVQRLDQSRLFAPTEHRSVGRRRRTVLPSLRLVDQLSVR